MTRRLITLVGVMISLSVFAASTFNPSPEEITRLKKALEPCDAQYDPAEQMLKEKFRSPGYHTTLKGGYIHSTRSSLNYAVALLDTGDAQRVPRAEAILKKVISLQDQNPQSKTYGIWSWFLEEPLGKMSPPDWNWADFCGAALLQIALDHRHRISPEVAKLVDEAIQHAARSIKKRDVGPGYTNIAIMGSYVTLVAADLYALADLREYAEKRWRNFYEYTQKQGSFTEYNSPTYTIVALKELGRMRQHVRNPEMRALTEKIYRLAWQEIAQHFHAPTHQWAGPHSRCYGTLAGASLASLITRATAGRVNLGMDEPSLDEARIPLPCPADLEPFFKSLDKPRELRRTFVQGNPGIVGTTYLHPDFAVGSINRGDMWNQRRNLLAYWGTASAPAYLSVRLLRDEYDFSAGQFFCLQKAGSLVAAINLATDGGNTHVSLDRIKNATFQAQDLRLRFELGGAGTNAIITPAASIPGNAHIQAGNLQIQITVNHASFDQQPAHWEAGGNAGTRWLDVVLLAGPNREINLSKIDSAAIGWAMNFTTAPSSNLTLKSTRKDGVLQLSHAGLELQIPEKPAPIKRQQTAFTAKAAN